MMSAALSIIMEKPGRADMSILELLTLGLVVEVAPRLRIRH